ncbi:MAG: valine--tRNA ligase [Candidatus Omnitrophica bacterium]|nr:valine--tRNA ligase [Candidatus Omnitrophota bacterium]
MEELSKCYNPKETEDIWYKYWEEKGYFSARYNPDKKPFSIVIPPPNVTGILHMGHALNDTIQDILIRYHRMLGYEALWMPGTDHAGIATQNVVERQIAKEGLKRQDLGREQFLQRVWMWKEQYGSTIIRQLKKLGASCDWQRTRFTMDEDYSEAVVEVFVSLYEKGLIYQGNYIINWCPRCQTALSDEEGPHHDIQGNLYYLKYPLKENPETFVIVATTRPETMLGDTAVVVNPKDKRYKKLIGKTLVLPLVNREISIIADPLVDQKFGTGAVKVTPAHDPNDYAMGKKHNLEFINVMYPDGRMNEYAGTYKDMDRFEAREVIIEDLREQKLLEKIEPYQVSARHCYRCHTIIEPYLSKQWFVKMKPLAQPGIEAVKKGKIVFHPKRWTKIYLHWMENIQDWCISRQIWWGHRLPVYYCKNCLETNKFSAQSQQSADKTTRYPGVIVSKTPPQKCPVCDSSDIVQDEDVLDTWFSSWLWPFATFGWPFTGTSDVRKSEEKKKELNYFYPTAALVTAPEIIFFWVARMIMAGFEFMGDIPFKDVYIHGTVRDIEGKKMSKSLGNVIDPLEIINEYGTDALRFSLISITSQGQDVFLSKERFEQGRNFANKIWNASRFVMMNLDKDIAKTDLCVFFEKENLDIPNRWILSRFYSTLKELNKNLESYKFNDAAGLLYRFFWHEYCDWYLEMIKKDIKNPQTQVVMFKVLEKFLRVIHPLMPFISEEIWQKLCSDGTSIMIQKWPHLQPKIIDKKTETKMNTVIEVITTIRNMRAELEVPVQESIEAKIFITNKAKNAVLSSMSSDIQNLAKLSILNICGEFQHAQGQFVSVLNDMHIVIPLTGLADGDKYRQRIGQKIAKAESEIKAKENMLKNQAFVERAPVEVVEKEKNRLKELTELLTKLKAVKHGLE